MPGGRSLLLERLVVLVDDDHGGQPGHGAQAALRPPITTSTPPAATAQSWGITATVSPARRIADATASPGRPTARRPGAGRSRRRSSPPASGRWSGGAAARRRLPRGSASTPASVVRRRARCGCSRGMRRAPPGPVSAACRKCRRRPAQRTAAHSASSINVGRRAVTGDLGDRLEFVDRRVRPAGRAATTHPPMRRPWRSTRTRSPTCDVTDRTRERRSRTPCRARDVRQHPGDGHGCDIAFMPRQARACRGTAPDTMADYRPTAALKSSRRLVSSQVKPGRPKWP